MDDAEKIIEIIKQKTYMNFLVSFGLEEVAEFVNAFVKHGCPVDAVMAAIAELAEKQREAEYEE